MRSFHEFMADFEGTDNLRRQIVQMINRLSHLEPRDVEDTKDLLLDLQKMVDDKLTGT
jgi:hypothetical protein